jgi:hypothetical protein
MVWAMSNPNAVALGKMARGKPKTMSPAAMAQRKKAAKASSRAAKERRKNSQCQ